MNSNQPLHLLVLGAGGRLGTLLRAAWALDPPVDTNLSYQSRHPLPQRNSVTWTPGADFSALPACDAVVSLWGCTSGDAEALQRNAAFADISRSVALACGARLLVHMSSAAVYGPAQNATEATAPAPINAYGASKLDMERRVGGFDDPSLRHMCLRVANVVGADSLAPGLTGPDPISLDRFEDGVGPQRSYIGAGDLARLLTRLARCPHTALPRVLNVAAPAPVSMEDLARAAGKPVKWRPAPQTAVQSVTMDTSTLRRLLPDVTPSVDPDLLIASWRRQVDTTEL